MTREYSFTNTADVHYLSTVKTHRLMGFSISKGMAKSALGALGYLRCDGGTDKIPIICFHSSPRSSDEYREVLPLLAASGRRVIALDSPGYGISENPPKSCSVDDVADAFLEVADSLGIDKFIAVGSLMGNFPAVSLASRKSDRVSACILANLWYSTTSSGNDDAKAPKINEPENDDDESAVTPIPDSFVLKDDGSHLTELHNKRKWLDEDLNLRVVQSELNYLVNRRERYKKGITIQDLSEYDFETPATKTKCPTLCIRGEANLAFFDAIGYKGTETFESGSKLFSGVEIQSMTGEASTLNMINQAPEEFASLCNQFLEKNNL